MNIAKPTDKLREAFLLFQAPRGTFDIVPEEQPYRRYIEVNALDTANRFGYERIDTPAFEDSRLFVRSIGEATDIVEKETYTFEDRGGDLITLRPEGTAPVCRAYLEHGMANRPQPVRLFYLCPLFRYERPQSGRFRQHHQFGVEVFGDGDPSIDAEVIELGWRFLHMLGLDRLSLGVNSIGDPECRPRYIEAVKGYYHEHVSELCADCVRRLEHNPLRLLDCKTETCQPLITRAPHGVDFLCTECETHWSNLLSHLRNLDLPYEINHRLVRGFDYYTRTVFEITPPVEGSQNTLIGGGRYDGLISELGGRPTPGIGFGMGIERVIVNLKRQEVPLPDLRRTKVVVAHVGDASRRVATSLSSDLRQAGIATIAAPATRGLRSQLRYASSVEATHVLILGDDELSKGTIILRDLNLGKQNEIELSTHLLVKHLAEEP